MPRQPQFAIARPQARPDRPPLAGALRRGQKRPKPVTRFSSIVSKHPVFAGITTFRAVAGLVLVGAIGLGITAWTLTGSSDSSFASRFYSLPLGGDPEFAAEDMRLAILSTDPRKAFFGIPVSDDRVGFVVDSDATMAEAYIEPLASVLHTVDITAEPEPGTKRYGIVQAVSDSNDVEMKKVIEPVSGFPGASAFLHPKLAGGTTDLPSALAVAEKWHTDQIFLVFSKPIDQAEIDRLTQHAEQSGATAHVIALGEAARQDLSPISEATGGQFRPVEDSVLHELVQRCKEETGL